MVSGIGEEGLRDEAAERRERPGGDEQDEEGDAERDARRRPTGSSGGSCELSRGRASRRGSASAGASRGSLDEAGVDERFDVGDLLDDADLEQQVGRFLARTACELAGEELLVRRLVLPAQVRRPTCRMLAGLLHVGAHDLVGLRLVLGLIISSASK